MLTGQLVRSTRTTCSDPRGADTRASSGALGEPVVRAALRQAMRIMGHQFVMGRTIEEALERSRAGENARYRYSFDMLGEAALTARRRASATSRRIATAIGARRARAVEYARVDRARRASRSSCPRCIRATSSRKRRRVLAELAPRLLELCVARARRRHRPDARRRGGRAPRAVAGADRRRADAIAAARAAGTASASPCRRTRSARAIVDRLARATSRRRPNARIARAPGQGRVLGQRDQARAGARARRLSGVHAQGQHRRVVPRLRARVLERGGERSIRSSPRTTRTPSRRSWQLAAQARARVRVPAPARHGRGAVRRGRSAPTGSTCRAASTRRSARTKTCCRTWCAACSRTAPTPRSSIASSTRDVPIDDIVARSGRGSRRAAQQVAHPRIPLPRDLFGRSGCNSRGRAISPIGIGAHALDGASMRTRVARALARGADRCRQELRRVARHAVRNPANAARVIGTVSDADDAQRSSAAIAARRARAA